MSGNVGKSDFRTGLLLLISLVVVVGFLLIYYGDVVVQTQPVQPSEELTTHKEKTAEPSTVRVESALTEAKEEDELHAHGHEHAAEEETAEVIDSEPTIEFTLKTMLGEGGFYFLGVGGEIDGIKNPDLHVKEGDIVKVTLINGDGVEHDLVIFGRMAEHVKEKGEATHLVFRADEAGEYSYYCAVPGHREAGMEGLLIVE